MSALLRPCGNRRGPRAPRGWLASARFGLVALAAMALSGCADDSYLILTLRADSAPFAGITRIVVQVTAASGQPMATRTFAVGGSSGVTIDPSAPKTLSVSFSPDRSGLVNVQVSAGAATCAAGGAVSATIVKGGTAKATVTLSPSGCPSVDAGTDAPLTFPGCDPAVPTSCPATQTCYVDCANQLGHCVQGGTKGPGELCNDNTDCAPGTQCFDFNCPSTTRVCLKFCAGDDVCAASSNSAGTSTCRDPVLCPAMTTYKTCGIPCDPRGTATSGCPSGLNCFLFADPAGGADSPSCSCPAATRVGTDGVTCSASSDCAPGFICDQMTGGQFCRRLCKMGSAGDCPGGTNCAALVNNSVFGVCI